MKSSYLLKAAKKLLWRGSFNELDLQKTKFICIAINRAAEKEERFPKHVCSLKANDLRKMITNRLAGYDSVETWLSCVHNIPRRALTHKKVQKHRHAWVNLLIEEFKAKGD